MLSNYISKNCREGFYYLYLGGLCAMFLFRDVLSVSVPLIAFIGYFTFGYIVFNYDHFLALTVMMPLLGHGVQTNYLILIAIVFYLFRCRGKVTIKTPVVIVTILMVHELIHITIADDSVLEYLRYLVQYAYIGIVLSDSQSKKMMQNPIVILKTFIFMSVYFMLDVLLVTLQYIPFAEMMTPEFRFGSLTDLIGNRPSLGDNQNMVAMFAIVAISLVLVCINYEKKNYVIYSFVIMYLSFFGLLTASKTFLICLMLLALFVICILLKKSFSKTLVCLVMVLLAMFLLANTVFSDALSNVLLRFKADDITTGRSLLFQLYNDFIFSDVKNILFGIGLQNVDVKSNIYNTPHNAIQEIILCWGVVGLVMVLLICGKLFGQYWENSKREIIYILPFLMFLIFIQTIQFVRLPSIFGLLVLFYVVILMGGVANEEKILSSYS